MKAFVITEDHVRSLIRRSTLEDKPKWLLNSIIDEGETLMGFVFQLLCYHMPAYSEPVLQGHAYYTPEPVEWPAFVYATPGQRRRSHIRIIDPFDAAYNRCSPGAQTVFDHYLLESIYQRLEDLVGPQEARAWFDDVAALLEYIALTLESDYIRLPEDSGAISVCFNLLGNAVVVLIQ